MLSAIGWERARPLIACVGRVISEKRVRDAVEVIALLQRKGHTAYLLVVGDGPERAALERLTCELGVQPMVHFTGRVPEDGDSAALVIADVVVFPGVHGLAINQAMALGTPVVVADLPGPDGEMVRHGERGWRYRFGDLQAFADAIQSALSSPDRARIVTNAQEKSFSGAISHATLRRLWKRCRWRVNWLGANAQTRVSHTAFYRLACARVHRRFPAVRA